MNRCQQQNVCRIFWDFLPRLKIIQAADTTQLGPHTPHTHAPTETQTVAQIVSKTFGVVAAGRPDAKGQGAFSGPPLKRLFVRLSSRLHFYVFAQSPAPNSWQPHCLPPHTCCCLSGTTLTPNERGSK